VSEPHDGLSDADRLKVAAMVDYFVDILSKRYNTKPDEVVDAVRWYKEHREFMGRFKQAGLFSVISLMVSAALFAIWESAKAALRSLLGQK
jgi:hypothetical protein